jgi:cobalamin biosynthesis protein CobD/CbiB
MAKEPSEEQIYEEASKRVKEKKRFYGGLVTYLIVNTVLIVIWALSGRGYMWFLWPLGIWGAFVLGDFLRIFVFRNGGSDQQAIEKEVEKIKKESHNQ